MTQAHKSPGGQFRSAAPRVAENVDERHASGKRSNYYRQNRMGKGGPVGILIQVQPTPGMNHDDGGGDGGDNNRGDAFLKKRIWGGGGVYFNSG